MSKIVIFERGSSKWIEIIPGQCARLHSSIENATRFDSSFSDDKDAVRKLLTENNLDWLLKTLEFHNVEQRGVFWHYVSNFEISIS